MKNFDSYVIEYFCVSETEPTRSSDYMPVEQNELFLFFIRNKDYDIPLGIKVEILKLACDDIGIKVSDVLYLLNQKSVIDNEKYKIILDIFPKKFLKSIV